MSKRNSSSVDWSESHSDCEAALDLRGSALPVDRERVQAHLRSCASCRELHQELASLSKAIAELPLPSVPAGLQGRVTRRIRRARFTRRLTVSAAAACLLAMGVTAWRGVWNGELSPLSPIQDGALAVVAPAVNELQAANEPQVPSVESQLAAVFASEDLLLPPVIELRVLATHRDAMMMSINELALEMRELQKVVQ